MPTIKLVGLTKKFGKLEAIKDFSIEVKDKEFFVILGYPGAGKTTLLRLIAGLEKLDAGEVYVEDKPVKEIHPGDRDIAMMFQNLALYPDKTVYDNLAFPLKIKKTPKDEIKERVTSVARTLKIDFLLDRTPATLSGGERQRVALGRALVRRPKVFLLDEPLTNLDATLRVNMRVELKRLQMELGQTIIAATPDQMEAMSMGDRVSVLREGKLQQVASPDDVYERPVNTFVASFIGSPPMNLVDGTFEEDDGKAYINIGSSKIDATKFRDTIQKQAKGSELILGIRPEDLEVELKKPSKEAVQSTLYLTEPLGSKSILHLTVQEKVVKAIVPLTFHAEFGEKVWLHIDPEKIHVFDKKTEKVLV